MIWYIVIIFLIICIIIFSTNSHLCIYKCKHCGSRKWRWRWVGSDNYMLQCKVCQNLYNKNENKSIKQF